ncbi:unnamed protein product [Enterobius vermicularis]|uniref:Secreted protein n=1 Tax=Enterobius vermicularis TaxID=51028 RepID=A0A0N4VLU6_ENTVE|nr:unnamed protein product [Enterobius vermicularis]
MQAVKVLQFISLSFLITNVANGFILGGGGCCCCCNNRLNRPLLSLNGGFDTSCLFGGIPIPVGGLLSPYGPFGVQIPYWMGGATNFRGPWITDPTVLRTVLCRLVMPPLLGI